MQVQILSCGTAIGTGSLSHCTAGTARVASGRHGSSANMGKERTTIELIQEQLEGGLIRAVWFFHP